MEGGGGGHPDFIEKLDFEVAVEQQTRARDQTFEGVPVTATPMFGQFIAQFYQITVETMLCGALLVATYLLNICI